MTVAEMLRELPAGDSRNLPLLDRIAEGLRAQGEDVEVVYVPRGDLYRIVPRKQVA
ncbi:hypothetical protein [Streptomyces sp. ME19-01-6]|uniref:hypothetical protein n=1 Tax=Streptomyces sp. ME19-01-6 TaxID=3028686 RepID=UPI0029A31EB3|nr:hypothetical protein [Streptomyces sp. ME19-01-6]MDX3230586.1 hypothetical protein [Streptomyces sp. ME19-01-6]